MPRNRLFAVLSLLTLLAPVVTGGLAVAQDTRLPPQRSPAPEHATPESALRSSPVMFLENAGQFDSCARFQVRGALGTMWLADDAIWIAALEKPSELAAQVGAPRLPGEESDKPEAPRKGVNLKLSFVGGNPRPVLQPFDRLDTRVSYFIGKDPDKWRPAPHVWG